MAIVLTKKAEDKVKEILSEQPEPYAGLRIQVVGGGDRKSTRLNSSHLVISYAVFCLKKKKKILHLHWLLRHELHHRHGLRYCRASVRSSLFSYEVLDLIIDVSHLHTSRREAHLRECI